LSSGAPGTVTTPRIVDTEGGPVTLLDIAVLRTRAEDLRKEADQADREAKSLRGLAEGLWVQVGRQLTIKLDQWSPSPPVANLAQQAVLLTQRVATDDSKLESLRASEHGGIGGLAGKVGHWNENRQLTNERADLELSLRPLLVEIAKQSSEVSLPEVDAIRGQALAADVQAAELEQRATLVSTLANAASEELSRRTESEKEMGFDAPALAAYLKTYGPKEVESPLILKRGERACTVVSATLARQHTRRQWVGGSQGFSFPIGHTGIRYRVGSFHGHPIEQQSLAKLDSGTLVVTNQRLAFIGQVKSTSVPFTKLLHVQCYSDSLAVFQEGRENPDFYLMGHPKYALFMINWFLNQAASSAVS
jgi:hypothetical protein